jgi:hypothetical protein
MSHIHWVARQNKLEKTNNKGQVNTREIHKCDGQVHDPDTMVTPLTPKPTRKTETLSKFYTEHCLKSRRRRFAELPRTVSKTWIVVKLYYESIKREPKIRCIYWLLFMIRVKRELKRVYKNGCRYNERLNAETGGSKTPRTHWVAWVNI